MPDGDNGSEGFFVGGDGEAIGVGDKETGRSENPGVGGVPGSDGEKSPAIAGPDGGFAQTPKAEKRRYTKRSPKWADKEKADGFRPELAVDNAAVLKSTVTAYADAIRARHAMAGFFLNLSPAELPDENKVQALALAWVRFHQEFPKLKVNPKTEALLGMAAANSAAYLPLIMAAAIKAKARATAIKRPGFNIPPVNPGFAPGVPPNGVDPTATRRAAPGGEEIVLTSGVAPDGGKISFE